MTTNGRGRALGELLEGNGRFVRGAAERPRSDPARRAEIAAGQLPFAAVVACSDSRVSPEIIFDQGLGDLFVLRTAGNLVDDVELASLEYAALHFDIGLIAVVGHSRCGAVTAAAGGGEAPGHLAALASALAPSVEKARRAGGDVVDAAARENVRSIVAALRRSEPVLRPRVDAGRLEIAGLYYDLEQGTVAVIA
jgi:carbonic anhydrase